MALRFLCPKDDNLVLSVPDGTGVAWAYQLGEYKCDVCNTTYHFNDLRAESKWMTASASIPATLKGDLAMACNYSGRTYSDGSLICANGRELKCSGGSWQETGFRCGTRAGFTTATLSIQQELLDTSLSPQQLQDLGNLILESLRLDLDLERKPDASGSEGAGEMKLMREPTDSSGNAQGERGKISWELSINQPSGGTASVNANASIQTGGGWQLGAGVSGDKGGVRDVSIRGGWGKTF
jgi:hypothetical protein